MKAIGLKFFMAFYVLTPFAGVLGIFLILPYEDFRQRSGGEVRHDGISSSDK